MHSPLPAPRRRSPPFPLSGQVGWCPPAVPACGGASPSPVRSSGSRAASRARCAALPPGVCPLAPREAAGPPGHPEVGGGGRGSGGPGSEGAEGPAEGPAESPLLALPAPPGGCGASPRPSLARRAGCFGVGGRSEESIKLSGLVRFFLFLFFFPPARLRHAISRQV